MSESTCAICLNKLVGLKDDLLKDTPVVALSCGKDAARPGSFSLASS